MRLGYRFRRHLVPAEKVLELSPSAGAAVRLRNPQIARYPFSGARKTVYNQNLIVSFRESETKTLFQTGRSRKFRSIERVAKRKLDAVNTAGKLVDLRVPPGNRLEALRGNRAGQHSVRVNDQYRICFVWAEGGPQNVEITDYH